VTTTIPAGTQGNDGPLTTTRETWYSPELKLAVLTVSFNPLYGVQTHKFVDLRRLEPDPTLFWVPFDFTVVDETKTFTVRWGQ
jgi:hypothetical protein